MKKAVLFLFAMALCAQVNAQAIPDLLFDYILSNQGAGKIIEFDINSGLQVQGYRFISTNPLSGKLNLETKSHNKWKPTMTISSSRVGIGTENPDATLTVKGKIHAEEVKVDLNVPADYVFQKYFTGSSSLNADYELLSLTQVEEFIKTNHHLPDVPSAKIIQEEGLLLKEMTNLLLQKVEELTLYTIEQEKRINLLESQLKENK